MSVNSLEIKRYAEILDSVVGAELVPLTEDIFYLARRITRNINPADNPQEFLQHCSALKALKDKHKKKDFHTIMLAVIRDEEELTALTLEGVINRAEKYLTFF